MNMTKTQANKIIKDLFNAIPDIYQGFHLVRDNMERLELKAEKEHRYNRGSVKGFSANDAARYFTIQHLHDGKDNNYTIESIIDIRYEALLGCAYAKRYADKLQAWFEMVDNSQFKDIDYAELMKD